MSASGDQAVGGLRAWRISVDAGGTFTDAIGVDPAGNVHRCKVLSSGVLRGEVIEASPGRVVVREKWGVSAGFCAGGEWRSGDAVGRVEADARVEGGRELRGAGMDARVGDLIEIESGEDSAVLAARVMTGAGWTRTLPRIEMRLGTTRGTNALLERAGERVALFVNTGFEDLLRIGTQQRPHLFRLKIEKPVLLTDEVFGVRGRLEASGRVLIPLDEAHVAEMGRQALARGCTSACVSLLHGWANDEHERRVTEILEACGFSCVVRATELAGSPKWLARTQTAVVEAYLRLRVRAYARRVERACGSLRILTSAGGLVGTARFRAVDSLLSGPAGGVAGAMGAGLRSGFPRVLSFDMGGTSTDVARCAADAPLETSHVVGDVEILSPAVGVVTVAAGGGSVCWFDSAGTGTLRVGPRSAGADPGPACYGGGGPLTITDCNLLLGRLSPGEMGIPIRVEAAQARATELCEEVARATRERLDLHAMLEGLLRLANERMAQAMREVSIAKGYSPGEHALVALGGAGGLHACEVAALLGIERVVVPRDAGLLSARGVYGANPQRELQRTYLARVSEAWEALCCDRNTMNETSAAELITEGANVGGMTSVATLHVRWKGQEATIPIEWAAGEAIASVRERSVNAYAAMYGYAPADEDPEIERLVVVVRAAGWGDVPDQERACGEHAAEACRVWANGAWRDGERRTRRTMACGPRVVGPAIVGESHATTFVPPGWEGCVDHAGALILSHGARVEADDGRRTDAIEDAVFQGAIGAIVTDMGRQLERTARSTNVKERLDYSCALLDAQGRLIVNAPHIPVHLGALGECVRRVAEALPLEPGDVAMTNHPAFGGSHLPDLTVISPVFVEGQRVGYVANRAHHAEVGGLVPGSLPPGARTLADEGVVVAPMLLVRGGHIREEELRRLFSMGPFPSRDVGTNIADLRAQVAANTLGVARLTDLVTNQGIAAWTGRVGGLHTRCAAAMRSALSAFGSIDRRVVERLDDGSEIHCRLAVSDGRAVIDFAGTSGVHAGNLNAPLGVIRSAVLYVLRLLIHDDVPLSEGLFEPIDLRVPLGMLNPSFMPEPERCPAVGAGNVEVSQRVVDTLLKAFGVAACSQGTMNNVIFGNEQCSFYETICGGAGAIEGADGADAVHTHMTNTRITDPEIIEMRYPVRLECFWIRRRSGGEGRWRGGDGVVRTYRFLEPVSLSVLTQHRAERPYAMHGGKPGSLGSQWKTRRDGRIDLVLGTSTTSIEAGEAFTIETPGGGGWGASGTVGASP